MNHEVTCLLSSGPGDQKPGTLCQVPKRGAEGQIFPVKIQSGGNHLLCLLPAGTFV